MKTAISPGRRGKEKLPYMNVDIQAPPDDFGGSEGMCGNWNGVVGDDLKGGDGKVYTPNRVADFTKSWT